MRRGVSRVSGWLACGLIDVLENGQEGVKGCMFMYLDDADAAAADAAADTDDDADVATGVANEVWAKVSNKRYRVRVSLRW